MFVEAWMTIDVRGTLKIPAYCIVELLYKLKPPMGFNGLLGPLHQVGAHETNEGRCELCAVVANNRAEAMFLIPD